MSEITAPPEPRPAALSLIRQIALDEPRRTDGPPEPNWEMYDTLTAALEGWHAHDTLRENSLLLMEWLVVELHAYLLHQLGDQHEMKRWLHDFGDEVCQTQQHAHPAGPTAIEILAAVVDAAAVPPEGTAGAERLVRIGAPYLRYLRAGHDVEDTREIALTFAHWAGSQMAALMQHQTDRITGYLNEREGRTGGLLCRTWHQLGARHMTAVGARDATKHRTSSGEAPRCARDQSGGVLPIRAPQVASARHPSPRRARLVHTPEVVRAEFQVPVNAERGVNVLCTGLSSFVECAVSVLAQGRVSGESGLRARAAHRGRRQRGKPRREAASSRGPREPGMCSAARSLSAGRILVLLRVSGCCRRLLSVHGRGGMEGGTPGASPDVSARWSSPGRAVRPAPTAAASPPSAW